MSTGTSQEGYFQPASLGRIVIVTLKNTHSPGYSTFPAIVTAVHNAEGNFINVVGFHSDAQFVGSIHHRDYTGEINKSRYWDWPSFTSPIPLDDAQVIPGFGEAKDGGQ